MRTNTYDALDNLTSTSLSKGATARRSTHNIDPVTNRLTSISSPGTAAYNFGYEYDSQGNIKRQGAQAFTFDQGNRMASVTGKATYAYDGLGRRTSIVGRDGINKVQVYSQSGLLLYVKATNSPTASKNIYLKNHALAEVNGASTTYYHTDALGSPIARTNLSASLISRSRYEPYGHTAGGVIGNIGFTGHVNDSDSGLVYMQQRYYDPVAARFLSIDPVTSDANTGSSFNRYVYANNSPYSFIDTDGRIAELNWTASKRVTYTVRWTMAGVPAPFTPAQANAQIAQDYSGTD